MLVSYSWLKDFFNETLPSPEDIARMLTFHSFEVEDVAEQNGDFVLDIDVLPNRRHDCFCHRGIAKEIALLTNQPFTDPLAETPTVEPTTDALAISLDTEVCRRYSAAVISNIAVGPSPEWLTARLEAIGQKSVNNVVDVTNYVMFLIGQPMHAFDAALLESDAKGNKGISVRNARDGENIKTLDTENRTLTEADAVIVDSVSDTPIGIAGVKGGSAAEITDTTTDIVLESAHFAPTSVRHTAQRLKLRTDASARFENTVPPELTLYALNIAVQLLTDIAGGTLVGYVDAYPDKRRQYYTGVSQKHVEALLGAAITEDTIADIFNRLGFTHEQVQTKDRCVAEAEKHEGVPYTYGARISFDAPDTFDCSSFVAFCYARAGVSIPRISVDQFVFGEPVTEDALQAGDVVFANSGEGKIRYETVTFMPNTAVPEGVDHCGIYVGDGEVMHACKKAGAVVREKLSESEAFKNIVGYRSMASADTRFAVAVPFERMDIRGPEDLIEEIGRVYGYDQLPQKTLPKSETGSIPDTTTVAIEKARDALATAGYTELYTYTLRESGKVKIANPLSEDKAYMRDSLTHGLTEAVLFNIRYLDLLALETLSLFEIGKVFPGTDAEYTELAIVSAARGKKAPVEEAVSTALAAVSDALGIDASKHVIESGEKQTFTEADTKGVYVMVRVQFDDCIAALPQPQNGYVPPERPRAKYKPISPYPFVLRDIAVWVPKGTESDALLTVIKEKAGSWLASWRLFDVYEKDDRISYAFRLAFQADDKTLSNEEVNAVMESVESVVRAKGWDVR